MISHKHLLFFKLSILISLLSFSLNINRLNAQTGLDVKSNTAVMAKFDGTTGAYISLFENGVYRGYLGSFSALTGVDFGTGGFNPLGKVHLTIQGTPKFTLNPSGDVGIGTINPTEKLHLNSGNILLDNSPLGVRLNGADGPMITRKFDAFSSGNYSGLGRWGLFMEPHRLTFGIPNIAGKQFEFAKYNSNSTRSTVLTIDRNGEINSPATGSANLLPIAFGNVAGDATINSGSGNFSAVRLGPGRYKVSLIGHTYNDTDYSVFITPIGLVGDLTWVVSATSGGILVLLLDQDGYSKDTTFNFLVYKS